MPAIVYHKLTAFPLLGYRSLSQEGIEAASRYRPAPRAGDFFLKWSNFVKTQEFTRYNRIRADSDSLQLHAVALGKKAL